jgi:urease accessory protein
MKKTNLPRCLAVTFLALAAAGAARAHPGHGDGGLAAGFMHPFMGMDHLLAMVAVGLWSIAALPPGRRWAGPAAFLALLLAGAWLAAAGTVRAWPALETGVAASVLVFALLVLFGRRIAPVPGLALVAAGALLHGLAHGSELAPGHAFSAYAGGFMAASALLHAGGLAAGARLQRLPAWAWRGAGGVLALGGVALLAARF